MFRLTVFLLVLVPLAAAGGLAYPYARVSDVSDDLSGYIVSDPYRWMEDMDSEETAAWIAAEDSLWEGFIGSVDVLDEIRARLHSLYDYRRISSPYRHGERYFFQVNDGLQDHSVLCWSESLGGEPAVLLDPNAFPPGLNRALSGTSVSDDGSMLAWAYSDAGSDWTTWLIRDVASGVDYPDTLLWTKTSWVAWANDGSGFYYDRYEPPAEGEEYTQVSQLERVFFHRVGTPQSSDSLVFERPDHPEWSPYLWQSDDGRYLFITIWDASQVNAQGLFYIDLESDSREVVELLGDFDASWSFAGNVGETVYMVTNMDAPRNRIVAIDLSEPGRENWTEVVPEAEEVLEYAGIMNRDRSLVLHYEWGGYNRVRIMDLETGAVEDVAMPVKGCIWGFGGRQDYTETFYTFTSFLHPGEIYRYDFETGGSELLWAPEIDADLSGYSEEQVWYESFDGTRVPMFLVYDSDIRLDGSNPTILYGYGGFGVSTMPWFSVSLVPWLEMGGVYAAPCIRGGGEFGDEWHLAGVREGRESVFRDFMAAAEYLIDQGYTSTPKLAISGASNGGTLVGAVLNMRPDLFGAALAGMGVMDLLRYHLYTVGWYWKAEYGDPDAPEDVPVLLAMSPYHNIRDGVAYPAVMISTADHDDRVVPAHSFKYAARLQAAQAGDEPILIAIHPSAGHGGAVGLLAALDRIAEEYAFLWEVLEMGEGGQ